MIRSCILDDVRTLNDIYLLFCQGYSKNVSIFVTFLLDISTQLVLVAIALLSLLTKILTCNLHICSPNSSLIEGVFQITLSPAFFRGARTESSPEALFYRRGIYSSVYIERYKYSIV